MLTGAGQLNHPFAEKAVRRVALKTPGVADKVGISPRLYL